MTISTSRVRRSFDERIKSLREEIAELEKKQQEELSKKTVLTKSSLGVEAAIAALELVVKENKTTMAEVIKLIAKTKRTGLTIEKTVKRKEEIKTSENESSPSEPQQL